MPEALPYEFHVTVEPGRYEPDAFRKLCLDIGTKAIILDLGINNGSDLTDAMTSSHCKLPSDRAAFDEVERIAAGLAGNGHTVIRRKIETVPWHPAAPQRAGDAMPEGSYFEAHMALNVAETALHDLRSRIVEATPVVPLHLSRNAFKPPVDGKLVIMTTLRRYSGLSADFIAEVGRSIDMLEGWGYDLTKRPDVEFALYDTNAHQDDTWMKR